MQNVSFIGLGIMGKAMAANLLKHDITLTVFNRSKAALQEMLSLGAQKADSIQQAVQGADVVITMLANPAVVNQVMLADGAQHMPKKAIWVDSTTVDPTFTKLCAEQAKLLDIRFLEAPVAGTKPHAEKAELTYFIGGDEHTFKQVEPLLKMMSQKQMYLGDHGSASAFKLIVNGMLAHSMLVFAEALEMGKKMGMKEDFLLNTLPNLPVIAPFTKMKVDMIRGNNFPPQFPLEHMQKDLHLLSKVGYELQHPLFMTNIAKEIYTKAINNGHSRDDFSAVVEEFK